MSFQLRPVYVLFISILFFLSSVRPLFPLDTRPENPGETYILQNGAISLLSGAGVSEISLNGDVTAIFTADGGVYYVRHDDRGYTAGFYTTAPSGSFEFQVLHQSCTVERFMVSEKILYILFKRPGELPDSKSGELVRLNPYTGGIDTVKPVADFGLAGGTVFIIRGREICYNGNSIPLVLEGDLSVKAVVDERLVLVGSGDETEVCDLRAGRNIYQYSATEEFPVNDEYNLVIEFMDAGGQDLSEGPGDDMVYYNIIVNGYEDVRTEIAPGRIVKTSYLQLDPGRHYLIRMERWELDRARGRYVRANNIMQPGELKVFVPENRGLKILVQYEPSGYNIKQGVYRGNEK